jgi:hypothetical protein
MPEICKSNQGRLAAAKEPGGGSVKGMPAGKARPSSSQQVMLARHLSTVLGAAVFRRDLEAFRERWGLKRGPGEWKGVWMLPTDKEQPAYETDLRNFARYYFRGLGGFWLATRLITGTEWEQQSVGEMVEELISILLKHHPTAEEMKTAGRRDMTLSHAYYAGELPFHPTHVWYDKELREDLKEDDWRVEPSPDESPRLTHTRAFIEIFPWTEEEDVLWAFRQIRLFALRLLPKRVKLHKDLQKSLNLYNRYCKGEPIDKLLEDFQNASPAGADERDLRRHLSQVSRHLGLPRPRRPKVRSGETSAGMRGADET